MALQCVLWDLDGTVLDSAPGLIFSIRKVLEHFELPPQPEEMLRLACGPLLSYSIEELFGNKGRFVPEMEVYMDEVYAGEGMGLERIFPGIPSCTGLVHRYGRPNCIVTVKPDHLKKHSVRYHPMLQYMFDSWIGTDEMNGIARKEDLIRMTLEKTGFDASECVLIGDRATDIRSARNMGVKSIAVRHGYAAPGELESAEPDRFADTIEQLYDLLEMLLRGEEQL